MCALFLVSVYSLFFWSVWPGVQLASIVSDPADSPLELGAGFMVDRTAFDRAGGAVTDLEAGRY